MTLRRGAVVLCGGRSRRMKTDKAGLEFGDETLLQRVVGLVWPAVDEIVVVAHEHQRLARMPHYANVIRDEIPDQGPLGGIAPGLRASGADACFVTACDVPFLKANVVRLLFDRLGEADVAVVEAQGHLQPLCGVYRPTVAPVIDRLLAEGRRRPVFLYDEVETVRVTEDEVRTVDPHLVTLKDVDTPEAYAKALRELRI